PFGQDFAAFLARVGIEVAAIAAGMEVGLALGAGVAGLNFLRGLQIEDRPALRTGHGANVTPTGSLPVRSGTGAGWGIRDDAGSYVAGCTLWPGRRIMVPPPPMAPPSRAHPNPMRDIQNRPQLSED